MPNDAPAPARQALRPTLAVLGGCAALVVGAVMLCARGAGMVVEDYDGMDSWVNPAAAAYCLGGVALVVSALVIGVVAAVRGRNSAR